MPHLLYTNTRVGRLNVLLDPTPPLDIYVYFGVEGLIRSLGQTNQTDT